MNIKKQFNRLDEWLEQHRIPSFSDVFPRTSQTFAWRTLSETMYFAAFVFAGSIAGIALASGSIQYSISLVDAALQPLKDVILPYAGYILTAIVASYITEMSILINRDEAKNQTNTANSIA